MGNRKYQQLQTDERIRVELWQAEHVSMREIGRRLGRSPSTISRELRRNVPERGNAYRATDAQAARSLRRDASRPKPKLHVDGVPRMAGQTEPLVATQLSHLIG
jgi:IS30 family transposase